MRGFELTFRIPRRNDYSPDVGPEQCGRVPSDSAALAPPLGCLWVSCAPWRIQPSQIPPAGRAVRTAGSAL